MWERDIILHTMNRMSQIWILYLEIVYLYLIISGDYIWHTVAEGRPMVLLDVCYFVCHTFAYGTTV